MPTIGNTTQMQSTTEGYKHVKICFGRTGSFEGTPRSSSPVAVLVGSGQRQCRGTVDATIQRIRQNCVEEALRVTTHITDAGFSGESYDHSKSI